MVPHSSSIETPLESRSKMKVGDSADSKERYCSFYASNEGTELYETLKVIICFFCASEPTKRYIKYSVAYILIRSVSRMLKVCKISLELSRRGCSSMLICLNLGLTSLDQRHF